MKIALNPGLDKALYLWFSQKRSQGLSISGPLLCDKAIDFNKKPGGSGSFVASKGWLTNLKNRHAIGQLKLKVFLLMQKLLLISKRVHKAFAREGYSRDRFVMLTKRA